MLTEEQVTKLKEQIITQINSWNTSQEQKDSAIEQIEAMSSQELEEFLEKNNANKKQDKQECPFCLIASKKIESYSIAENSHAIAVLEINPVSQGHVLVIPKSHISLEKFTPEILSLIQKIAEKQKSVLNPKEVSMSTTNISSHTAINLIPITGKEAGERVKAKKEDLEKLQKLLFIGKIEETEVKPVEIKKPEEKSKDILEQAPKRFP